MNLARSLRDLLLPPMLAALAGAALAAPQYQLTDLGTLGGPESDAMAITRRGRIVGFSNTRGVDSHYRAFAYANGRMSDLGGLTPDHESFAKAVNPHGVACGSAVAADFSGHAVVFSQGAVTDIHQLRTDWLDSDCIGINSRGHLVGTATSNVDWSPHAYFYANGKFTLLEAGTRANAINDNDQYTGSLFSAAFLVDHGRRTELGSFGGGFSEGVAINATATITGWAGTAGNSELHAFVWKAGAMSDLGTLGGWQSRGMAINTAGTVVGWSYKKVLSEQSAFIVAGGAMTDLNTLLDPVSGAGWHLAIATGIDDKGRITGSGVHDGFFHAFLLTPVAP